MKDMKNCRPGLLARLLIQLSTPKVSLQVIRDADLMRRSGAKYGDRRFATLPLRDNGPRVPISRSHPDFTEPVVFPRRDLTPGEF
jgi:hypothetical protein